MKIEFSQIAAISRDVAVPFRDFYEDLKLGERLTVPYVYA